MNARPDFSEPLLQADYAGLPVGVSLAGAVGPWRIPEKANVKVIDHDGARMLATANDASACVLAAGDENWSDVHVRCAVTPLAAQNQRGGGPCGIVARYRDARNFLALVYDRDGRLKLLRRDGEDFAILAGAHLPHEAGHPLSFALTVTGNLAQGEAGGVAIKARFEGLKQGKAGLFAGGAGRFGPLGVETTKKDAARLEKARAVREKAAARVQRRNPKLQLDQEVDLRGLLHGPNVRLADVDGDGRPELLVAQGSKRVAQRCQLTRLTCLTLLDLDGKVRWQAGVPDESADAAPYEGDLPFQIADVNGDGLLEVVCAFGFDLQYRDAKTGKLLWSFSPPEMIKYPVGRDFKEIAPGFGLPWGDEYINLDVAHLSTCNVQGRPSARDLLIKDDAHHFFVLDPFNNAEVLLRHRGVHGPAIWAGDLDGDGCDEFLAGRSFVDHTGKSLWVRGGRDRPWAAAALDLLAPGGRNRTILVCGGDDGLGYLALDGSERVRVPGSMRRMAVARFRSDRAGLQVATVTGGEHPGIARLHDAVGRTLWTRELPLPGGAPGVAVPVNWAGRDEELLLYALAPGTGLLNGRGEWAVEAPAQGPCAYADIVEGYVADGRDGLAAWDARKLAIYLPVDAPAKGRRKRSVYRPVRPGRENRGQDQARISLPPEW